MNEPGRDHLLRVASQIAGGLAATGRHDWEQVAADAVFAARLLISEVDRELTELPGPTTQKIPQPRDG